MVDSEEQDFWSACVLAFILYFTFIMSCNLCLIICFRRKTHNIFIIIILFLVLLIISLIQALFWPILLIDLIVAVIIMGIFALHVCILIIPAYVTYICVWDMHAKEAELRQKNMSTQNILVSPPQINLV
jgi:hypothetical protein